MKKYLILILCLFIGFVAESQTYNPNQATVSNKPYGPAQAVPTDSRSMYFDGTNFIWRWYQSTTEVLTYLNLAKYRAGNFIIVVDSGGVLNSNGTYTNGNATFWMFQNGTADGNLVELNLTGGGGGGCSGCLLAVNNLSDVLNAATARTNLGLGTISTQTITASGDLSGNWPLITVAKFNGQLPSYYLNYNNLFNTPVVPAQLNPTCSGCTITGSYPNLLWTVTSTGFTTAGVDLIALSSSTVALDTQHYRKMDTAYMINDSTQVYTINSRPDTLIIKGGKGAGGGGGSGSVTNVSVVTANGVSGVVANPTSTPAITLTLGAITPSTVNSLTLAQIANGFTITGGTGTPHTLTVNTNNTSVAGTNTGDITYSGENYLSLSGQALTGAAVNVSGSNITGVLKASAFPALTGPITTSAGALGTSVTNNAITNAMLAQMNTLTIKGNNTGGTANAADLTVAQVNAILPVFTTSLNGLVPTPGSATGKVLSDGGTWVTNGTGNTNTNVGAGYRWAIPGGNTIKTFNAGLGVMLDSTTVANTITAKVDTSIIQYKFQDTIFIKNVGASGVGLGYTGSDTLYFKKLVAGANITLTQNNDSSVTITSSGGGGGGITTIGAFDSQAKSTDGGVISGTSIYFQSADFTHPGMMNTVAQNIAGHKTYSAAPTFTTLTTPGGIFYGDGAGNLLQSGNGISTGVLHGSSAPFFSAVNLAAGGDVINILPVANGGTGTSTPGLVGGTGITISNAWPNQTVTAINNGTVTSINVSGGTTGVNFTGGPITVSGTITMSGTLIPANGGTGLSSLTPYAVIAGGSTATGTLQQVSGVGTVGQFLGSNGPGLLPSWQTPTGGGGSGLSRTTITSGTNSTVPGGNYIVTINPASLLYTYVLTMPSSPSDLDVVEIESGGTIPSGNQVVISFGVLANSGQTLVQANTPSALNAGEYIKYRYRSANTSWYREN